MGALTLRGLILTLRDIPNLTYKKHKNKKKSKIRVGFGGGGVFVLQEQYWNIEDEWIDGWMDR